MNTINASTTPEGRTAVQAENGAEQPVTLMNSFVVPEGRDEAFVALWTETSQYFRAQPGFLSLRLHRAVTPGAQYRYVNVAPRLRTALEKDKALRVLVASGYCDLATPFGGTNYTFAHLGPRELSERVTLTYYDAGHMMYTRPDSRKALTADAQAFFRAGNEQD